MEVVGLDSVFFFDRDTEESIDKISQKNVQSSRKIYNLLVYFGLLRI